MFKQQFDGTMFLCFFSGTCAGISTKLNAVVQCLSNTSPQHFDYVACMFGNPHCLNHSKEHPLACMWYKAVYCIHSMFYLNLLLYVYIYIYVISFNGNLCFTFEFGRAASHTHDVRIYVS